MKSKFIKAFNTLKAAGVPVYEHADDVGNFSIDCECAAAEDFGISYYALHDLSKLDALLSPFGLFAEWVNPGRMSIHN